MNYILKILADKLRDPFLVAMVMGIIILASVAISQTGLAIIILLAVFFIILFLAYLIFLYRTNIQKTIFDESEFESISLELAFRIIIAIQNEGYIPGNQRQQDFGAALAAKVRDAKSESAKRCGEIMASEFIKAFDVPESMR